MNKTLTSAAAVLALIALPAGVAAKPGKGNGNAHGHAHAPGLQTAPGLQSAPVADATQVDEAPAPPKRAQRRCRRAQSVGFTAVGSLAGFSTEDVTLDVTRANKHARAYIAAAGSTFTLGSARIRFEGVTDGDGDGTVGLADVLPTDRVVAIGKATRPKRGCAGESVLTLRKLQVVRPEADEDEVEDEA